MISESVAKIYTTINNNKGICYGIGRSYIWIIFLQLISFGCNKFTVWTQNTRSLLIMLHHLRNTCWFLYLFANSLTSLIDFGHYINISYAIVFWRNIEMNTNICYHVQYAFIGTLFMTLPGHIPLPLSAQKLWKIESTFKWIAVAISTAMCKKSQWGCTPL